MNAEIGLLLKECWLRFGDSIVASTSDFWWDKTRKASFGACIGTFMAKQYRLKNGIDLFISNATLATLSSVEEPRGWERILRSKASKLDRCQCLIDFCLFDRPHTGQEVGAWLYNAHKRVRCEPCMQGSQTVDGAANAGASIGKLQWKSSDERSVTIVSSKCDAHQANTSGQRASGTSAHKVNYNPELGKSLKKLHSNLVRITHSGKRMTVFRNVGREAKRTNKLTLENGNETRWAGKSCDY